MLRVSTTVLRRKGFEIDFAAGAQVVGVKHDLLTDVIPKESNGGRVRLLFDILDLRGCATGQAVPVHGTLDRMLQPLARIVLGAIEVLDQGRIRRRRRYLEGVEIANHGRGSDDLKGAPIHAVVELRSREGRVEFCLDVDRHGNGIERRHDLHVLHAPRTLKDDAPGELVGLSCSISGSCGAEIEAESWRRVLRTAILG